MPHFICTTCGAQYADSPNEPEGCLICQDERQFVNPEGQQWTVLEKQIESHEIKIRQEEPNLDSIELTPRFAIGQRALLIQTPEGNLMWDCLPLINNEIVQKLKKLGGVDAIAISHPDYYTGMVEWSRAFGNIPIYLHYSDQQWIIRPDEKIVLWKGEAHQLFGGLTMVCCGGHFSGGSILQWPQRAIRRGFCSLATSCRLFLIAVLSPSCIATPT